MVVSSAVEFMLPQVIYGSTLFSTVQKVEPTWIRTHVRKKKKYISKAKYSLNYR